MRYQNDPQSLLINLIRVTCCIHISKHWVSGTSEIDDKVKDNVNGDGDGNN